MLSPLERVVEVREQRFVAGVREVERRPVIEMGSERGQPLLRPSTTQVGDLRIQGERRDAFRQVGRGIERALGLVVMGPEPPQLVPEREPVPGYGMLVPALDDLEIAIVECRDGSREVRDVAVPVARRVFGFDPLGFGKRGSVGGSEAGRGLRSTDRA